MAVCEWVLHLRPCPLQDFASVSDEGYTVLQVHMIPGLHSPIPYATPYFLCIAPLQMRNPAASVQPGVPSLSEVWRP